MRDNLAKPSRTPHTVTTMQCYSRFTIAIVATLAIFVMTPSLGVAVAGDYTNAPIDLNISPEALGSAIPSGGINPGPTYTTTSGGNKYLPGVTSTLAPLPTNPENFLGCGGVGQGEYTSALFNMPETFGKFQRDVNSIMAKQILAMNYIMPQTAALFDQLNNYGDQRYQSFQQGCNLDSLRQNAKDQYLKECVAKIQPDRKALLESGGAPPGSPPPPAGSKPPYLKDMVDSQVDAWAYAQAWEICSNQYVSDTTLLDLRKKINTDFTKEIRRVENVTKAIAPLLCPFHQDNTDDLSEGCWEELLIPQVRVCLEGQFECSDAEGAYTVTEPLVGMQRLFDVMRYVLDEMVIARRVNPYTAELYRQNHNDVAQAGKLAALSTSYASLFRMTSGAAGVAKTTKFSEPINTKPVDKSAVAYQLGYLNCKDPDLFLSLKELRDQVDIKLNASGKTPPVLTELALSDVKDFVKTMKLRDGDGTEYVASGPEIQGFANMTWVSLGCAANHTVPLFDPNIVASISTKCMPADRYAYFTMAGYDVSMAATRDIYRYLGYRLKQVYAQLLTDPRVPRIVSKTAPPVSTTVSVEINNRLAAAVKDSMIPYVEAQLARLDEVQKTRGQFAQRVQQIYVNKTGCVYNSATPAPPTR